MATPKEIKDAVLLLTCKTMANKVTPEASKLFRKDWEALKADLLRYNFQQNNEAITFATGLSNLLISVVEKMSEGQNMDTLTQVFMFLKDLESGNVGIVADNEFGSVVMHEVTDDTAYPGGDDLYVYNINFETWIKVKDAEDWQLMIDAGYDYNATHWTRFPQPPALL